MRRFTVTRHIGLGGAMAALLALGGLAGCSDDDNAGDNNTNLNGNACTEAATRCEGSVLETCSGETWGSPLDCADGGRVCRADLVSGEAGCEDLAWVWRTVDIVDPVMQGTSLNTPVDGVSFGYDAAADRYMTGFGRDINDPNLTHLWRVDGADGTHAKQALSGDVFGPADGFCMGTEDWCQYVSYDAAGGEWVVLGPSTTSVMRVGATWAGTLDAVGGTHPPDNWINHTHRFAWAARTLYLYGALGPAGFSDTVHAFDLDTHTWSSVATGLPQTYGNCLAYDSQDQRLLAVGGQVTTDGGNTNQTTDSLLIIDPASGTHSTQTLPTAVGPRRAMSCAYDSQRHLLYVYGGAVVNDNWNEAENEYHQDLWALDLAQMTWTTLIPDGVSGTLNPPDSYGDQSFVGYPEGPNLGKNRGQMLYDADGDRLLIMGAVPIFTHEQLYWLRLEGVDQLL